MKDKNQKPNILLIMADQMTPFLTGAYGNREVKTPNLDRLVKRGVRFDSAYSPCPICAPARACLMTGKYASNHMATDNAAPLSCDQPTFCHYLTNEGYDTVLSGKMHFIGPDQLHGFEKRLVTNVYFADFEWTPTREVVKDYAPVHKNPIAIDYVTAEPYQYSMQFEYDEEAHFRGLQYIYSRRMQVGGTRQKPQKERDSRPFFMCVSYNHPHEPFHPTQEMWDMYNDVKLNLPEIPDDIHEFYTTMDKWLNKFHGVHKVDIKNKEALLNMRHAYYSLVTYVDNKVGELIKALEDTGLRDNTIIVFTSDHGDMLGEKGMVQKRTFYEYSCRVPLIINYPDNWKQGMKVSQHVSLVDLAPTILDFAGVDKEEVLQMDGESLVPLIDESNQEKREIFAEMHTEGVFGSCFMIRSGNYKYVYIHNYETQLFNLEEDPDEWNNLSGKSEYASVEENLKKRILSRFTPDEIERKVKDSIRRRQLIKKAMKISKTSWDYSPHFDATKQYWRDE